MAAIAATGFFFCSCALFGGGGGDQLARATNYHVTPDPSWKPADKREADQAYRLPSGGVATLTSSCHRDSTAPLETLTRHLMMGARKVNIKHRETIAVNGSEGLYSSVAARLDNTAFNLELFVLPKKGCIFDFTLISPKTLPPSEVADFKGFIKSFQYGKD
jgi:hypothetical protein